jgi:hypothetical protein
MNVTAQKAGNAPLGHEAIEQAGDIVGGDRPLDLNGEPLTR